MIFVCELHFFLVIRTMEKPARIPGLQSEIGTYGKHSYKDIKAQLSVPLEKEKEYVIVETELNIHANFF